jgi:hypothetical protein
MAYLEGQNITPRSTKEAKMLIGKHVQFLRKCDIDRSGRGYYFPRTGVIEDVNGKNLIMHNGDAIYLSDLVEMVEMQKESK